MIYINGIKATKEDFEMLEKWTKEGKTKATAKTTKDGNIEITTTD